MDLKTTKAKSKFNWSVLLIVSLTSITTGIYRNGFSALFPFLQRDFNLTKAQLGMHATLFYFTAALTAIYVGRLIDLKGAKWGLIFSNSLLGIFYILHSIIPNFTGVLFMAALTGIAMSFNMPTANKCIVEWFPPKTEEYCTWSTKYGFSYRRITGCSLSATIWKHNRLEKNNYLAGDSNACNRDICSSLLSRK